MIVKETDTSDEDENKYFDDSDDESIDFIIIFKSLFTGAVLMALVIFLLFKDSRPVELKSIFEPFDNYLTYPQSQIAKFISNFKKMKIFEKINLESTAEIDEQVEKELVRLKLEGEQRKKPEPVDETIFWKSLNEKIEKEINEISKIHQELEKEVNNQRAKRNQLVSVIIDLNNEINEQIKVIKGMNFDILNIDEIVKNIYKKIFSTVIIKSFLDDLEDRREKIIQVINHGKAKEKLLSSSFSERYFYKWFWTQKYDKEFIKKLKLKVTASLEDKVTRQKSKEFEDIFKDLELSKQETGSSIDLGKIVKFEDAETIEPIVNSYQELEEQLFLLLSKDLNFGVKIVDLLDLIKNASDFVDELKVLKVKGEGIDFEYFEIFFKRLERKIKSQELRMRTNNQFKNSNSNLILIESWHRRNLLKLFTNKKLTAANELGSYEMKLISEYSEAYNTWLKEKLLLLPSNHKFKVKEVEELKKKIENVAELNVIMTKKLSIFDHSPYEFLFDRIAKDYNKFMSESGYLIAEDGKLIYYDDGMLFKAAAFYGRIVRLNGARERWPKIASNDKSLLIDEKKYKESFVMSVLGTIRHVPVPESFWHLNGITKRNTTEEQKKIDDNSPERSDLDSNKFTFWL